MRSTLPPLISDTLVTGLGQDAAVALQWPLQPQDGQQLQVLHQPDYWPSVRHIYYLCQERHQPWIKERVESCRVASTLPQNLPSMITFDFDLAQFIYIVVSCP